ncbi:hypothetical protein ACUNEK_05550 [Serratia sp. IR-2025]|uniref:hypothetical protein n=1 Tax=Serratia marcescens TaxID=615 RepID=UPI00345B8776
MNINKHKHDSKLSVNQIAYLNRAMTDGKGLIEIGELARGLGKQKGHVIRKLEKSFDAHELSKMERSDISMTYLNGKQATEKGGAQ